MKPYYYVYKYGDNAPRVRHCTLRAATQEAERLAKENPGSTFEILQCLGFSRISKVSTFWVDGAGPEPQATAGYRYFRDGSSSLNTLFFRKKNDEARWEYASVSSPRWDPTMVQPTVEGLEIKASELPAPIKP
jgi:hypothetical protein